MHILLMTTLKEELKCKVVLQLISRGADISLKNDVSKILQCLLIVLNRIVLFARLMDTDGLLYCVGSMCCAERLFCFGLCSRRSEDRNGGGCAGAACTHVVP